MSGYKKVEESAGEQGERVPIHDGQFVQRGIQAGRQMLQQRPTLLAAEPASTEQ